MMEPAAPRTPQFLLFQERRERELADVARRFNQARRMLREYQWNLRLSSPAGAPRPASAAAGRENPVRLDGAGPVPSPTGEPAAQYFQK